jgi:hypothetical protein
VDGGGCTTTAPPSVATESTPSTSTSVTAIGPDTVSSYAVSEFGVYFTVIEWVKPPTRSRSAKEIVQVFEALTEQPVRTPSPLRKVNLPVVSATIG